MWFCLFCCHDCEPRRSHRRSPQLLHSDAGYVAQRKLPHALQGQCPLGPTPFSLDTAVSFCSWLYAPAQCAQPQFLECYRADDPLTLSVHHGPGFCGGPEVSTVRSWGRSLHGRVALQYPWSTLFPETGENELELSLSLRILPFCMSRSFFINELGRRSHW